MPLPLCRVAVHREKSLPTAPLWRFIKGCHCPMPACSVGVYLQGTVSNVITVTGCLCCVRVAVCQCAHVCIAPESGSHHTPALRGYWEKNIASGHTAQCSCPRKTPPPLLRAAPRPLESSIHTYPAPPIALDPHRHAPRHPRQWPFAAGYTALQCSGGSHGLREGASPLSAALQATIGQTGTTNIAIWAGTRICATLGVACRAHRALQYRRH